ncbi:MAG: S41 family peptidase [Vicinamibacterales bacterium]
MTRRPVRIAAATGLVALAVLCASARGLAQDWRSLAVASFDEAWRTINDTYFDPSFGGLDWPAVRTELAPRVASASSADAARDVLREMLGRLHQSHFVLLAPPAEGDSPGGPATVPVEFRLIEQRVVVTNVVAGSSAERAGVRRGDVILSVDRGPLTEMASVRPDDRVAYLAAWRRITTRLHGPDGSVAALRVTRRGRERDLRVMRQREAGEEVTLGNLPPLVVRTFASEKRTPGGRRVGLAGFNVWMPAVGEPFASAVDVYRTADGMVIDVRGNPGGLADMIRGIAGHFLDQPLTLGRMKMRDLELEFRANPRRSTTDGRRVTPYDGPVALLVDELTGSASECFAGGLQSLGRVRVFGVGSMGQALPAVTRELPNGDVLIYAVGDFVTSTGVRLEGRGVRPDEVVAQSIKLLEEGRDGPLDAALRWIDRVLADKNLSRRPGAGRS